MAVVHFIANEVKTRFLWASSIGEVTSRYGGNEGDYAVGDWPVGSSRDPETGAITAFSPPTPTSAEAAAPLVLSRADFLLALQTKLVEDAQIATTDDVVDHVVSEINAAEAAGVFDAATAMTARRLVKDATTFHRADPDRPGLMEAVGALPGVDLDGAAIDALFIGASRRGDQP